MYILVDLYNKTTKTLTESEAQKWIGDVEPDAGTDEWCLVKGTVTDNDVWDLEEYLVIKA